MLCKRHAERPGHVVPGAGRDNPERDRAERQARTGERIDAEVDHAVAAHYHQGVNS